MPSTNIASFDLTHVDTDDLLFFTDDKAADCALSLAAARTRDLSCVVLSSAPNASKNDDGSSTAAALARFASEATAKKKADNEREAAEERHAELEAEVSELETQRSCFVAF